MVLERAEERATLQQALKEFHGWGNGLGGCSFVT